MSARILVVDDIEPNRRLLQAKLEAKYFTVDLASSGQECLDKAGVDPDEQPDIILLDVMMPGMDGYETCEKLKANPDTAHIPVVMVTALSEREHRVRGLAAGAEDFLTKPVQDFALMARLNALGRYNAVAMELRQREASGMRAGVIEDAVQDELNRPTRALVIDENPRSSARIAEHLREGGHTAVTLHDEGGVDLADESADVVIVALGSKRFDPLRLCAHFKMAEKTRALSIIVVHQEHESEQAGRAMEIGASDMVQSPVDAQELLARVRTQTRRKRYIEYLRRRVDRGMELAIIDQLTGLYNRRHMIGQLKQHLQRTAMGGASLSIMIADIDHFKRINDTYGHEAGDKVLQELAARLRANVRPSDVVCRQGGEEFAVIMPDTPGDVACSAAERVRRAIAGAPFEIDGVPVSLDVTLSGGVASATDSSESPENLIKRADDALYRAKTSGRNRVESMAA